MPPNPLRRDQVIQSYLDLFREPAYLEIGVAEGQTFHAINAAKKVAVDPKFGFTVPELTPGAEYHNSTSDAYFASLPRNARSLFHVIFIDGLHIFEQTLRDLLNSIEFLCPNGVIVVDDIWPSSYHASLPDVRDIAAVKQAVGATDKDWMGDVYRLVYFVQAFLPRFSYATCEDNHGQLIMWRAPRRDEPVERRLEDIARIEFRQIVNQRDVFNFLPNEEIVRRVAAAVQAWR